MKTGNEEIYGPASSVADEMNSVARETPFEELAAASPPEATRSAAPAYRGPSRLRLWLRNLVENRSIQAFAAFALCTGLAGTVRIALYFTQADQLDASARAHGPVLMLGKGFVRDFSVGLADGGILVLGTIDLRSQLAAAVSGHQIALGVYSPPKKIVGYPEFVEQATLALHPFKTGEDVAAAIAAEQNGAFFALGKRFALLARESVAGESVRSANVSFGPIRGGASENISPARSVDTIVVLSLVSPNPAVVPPKAPIVFQPGGEITAFAGSDHRDDSAFVGFEDGRVVRITFDDSGQLSTTELWRAPARNRIRWIRSQKTPLAADSRQPADAVIVATAGERPQLVFLLPDSDQPERLKTLTFDYPGAVFASMDGFNDLALVRKQAGGVILRDEFGEIDVGAFADMPTSAAALSPRNDQIAIASQDGTIYVASLMMDAVKSRTLGDTFKIHGHGDAVTHLAFSLDGVRLASASLDGRFFITDLAAAKRVAGMPLARLGVGSQVEAMKPVPLDAKPSGVAEKPETATYQTEWMSGGHNQAEACQRGLASLQPQYSSKKLSVTGSSEESKKDFFGRVTYRYRCDYRVESGKPSPATAAPDGQYDPGLAVYPHLVVYGADKTLEAAQDEIRRAEVAGFRQATILLRDGWYRSVAGFATIAEQQAALPRLQALSVNSRGAYLRDVTNWCSSATGNLAGRFFDCATLTAVAGSASPRPHDAPLPPPPAPTNVLQTPLDVQQRPAGIAPSQFKN